MSERLGTSMACACGARNNHLTRREIAVLLLVAEGLEGAEIAMKLCVSVSTVQAHIKNMRHKAGVHAQAGLITRCYAAGVLLPGSLPPHWSGKYCLHISDSC